MKGLLNVLLTLAWLVTAFGAWQVFIDKGGKVSPKEAEPIFYGGVALVIVLMIVGNVVLKKGAKEQAPKA